MEDRAKVGFICTNEGVSNGTIGDWVYASSLPENFYKITGQKIIDLNKTWVFDYNPYVDREFKPNKVTILNPLVLLHKRNVPRIPCYSLMGFLRIKI